MKKILSVILSALIILSAFSAGAFATEAESTRYEKWCETHNINDGISVKIHTRANNMLISLFGAVIHFKDGKMAVEAEFDGKEFKAVTKDDDLCIFMTKLPIFHYKIKGDELFGSIDMDLTLDENTAFVESYETEVNGKALFVEEYLYDEGSQPMTFKFYFDGDELIYFGAEETIADMDFELYFEILSFEVDDAVFKMPAFSLDVTFLVDLFLKLGLFFII